MDEFYVLFSGRVVLENVEEFLPFVVEVGEALGSNGVGIVNQCFKIFFEGKNLTEEHRFEFLYVLLLYHQVFRKRATGMCSHRHRIPQSNILHLTYPQIRS